MRVAKTRVDRETGNIPKKFWSEVKGVMSESEDDAEFVVEYR